MTNKEVLYEMYKTYGKPTTDWMGYKVTAKNYITYHHIHEERNGGIEEACNGALLTRKAHEMLNTIFIIDRKLYDEYQYWFRIINDMKCPPSYKIMQTMYNLKKRAKEVINNNEKTKFSLEKAKNL